MKDYNIQHLGSSALPITAGTDVYSISGMMRAHERAYFEVTFFSDEAMQTKVTPTAGLVTILGAPTADKTWKTIGAGSYAASTDLTQSRSMPNGQGTMTEAMITFVGVDVAAYAKVDIFKYGEI